MGNLGKMGELADGSVFFPLIRIGFFTIVVSAIIQRAILYATVKSLNFKTPITHTKTDIASSINKGSIQNTLWDIAVSYTWVYVTGKV